MYRTVVGIIGDNGQEIDFLYSKAYMTIWKIVSLLLLEKHVLACFSVRQLAESEGDREHITFKGAVLERKMLSVEVPLRSGAAVGNY